MRLVSFNIRGGRGEDGRADEWRLRAALDRLDADVLALQEVDRGQERSGDVDQVGLAAAIVGVDGPAHVRLEPTLWGVAGRAAAHAGRVGPAVRVAQAGQAVPDRRQGPSEPTAPGSPTGRATDVPAYGIALVSRAPVRAWRRIDLPRWPVPLPWVVPGRHGAQRVCRVRDEPRVALAAVLAQPAPVRTVVTTHLSFLPGVNAVQLRRLAFGLRDLPRPLVLLGDLNLPGAVPGRLLPRWHALEGPPTFPLPDPAVRLDHVLLCGSERPPPWTAAAVPTDVSDHCAVVADLSSG